VTTQTHRTVPAAGAAFLSDLQTFARSEDADRFADMFTGFVVSGGTHATVAGLTATPTALVAYPGGFYTTESGSITYANATTTWVIAHSDTTGNLGTFTRVAGTHYLIDGTSPSQPALPSGCVWLMEVTTAGGAVTAVTDLRNRVADAVTVRTVAELPATANTGAVGIVTTGTGLGRYWYTGTSWVRIGAEWFIGDEHGLVGDDSTDNASTLSTLLNSVSESAGQPATVYLNPGVYRIASEVVITSKNLRGLRLIGDHRGAVELKWSGAADNTKSILKFDGCGFIHIEGISFTRATNQPGYDLRIGNYASTDGPVQHNTIARCLFDAGSVLHLELSGTVAASNAPIYWDVVDCNSSTGGIATYGVRLASVGGVANNVVLRNCSIGGTAANVDYVNGGPLIIENCEHGESGVAGKTAGGAIVCRESSERLVVIGGTHETTCPVVYVEDAGGGVVPGVDVTLIGLRVYAHPNMPAGNRFVDFRGSGKLTLIGCGFGGHANADGLTENVFVDNGTGGAQVLNLGSSFSYSALEVDQGAYNNNRVVDFESDRMQIAYLTQLSLELAKANNVALNFYLTNGALPAGAWRLYASGSDISMQQNTHVTTRFSSVNTAQKWDQTLISMFLPLFLSSTYAQMDELAADADAPAADQVRIYAKDNGGGKTGLYARFPTGAVQQIALEP